MFVLHNAQSQIYRDVEHRPTTSSTGSNVTAGYLPVICTVRTSLVLVLLNRVSVEAEVRFDGLQYGTLVNWSFDESQQSLLQELSSTDVRWVAMRRDVLSEDSTSVSGWKWSHLDNKVSLSA